MEKELALELKGISKYFGTLAANKNVDLDVYRGEILSILGENGCGKTTLEHCILSHLRPQNGQILIRGKKIEEYSSREFMSI